MTYPAPLFLEDDPWFGPAPISEFNQKYLEEQSIFQSQIQEEVVENQSTVEPENIHQVMYEMATNNVATTLSLNPMPPLGGGSEKFHEGPGGWMSGTGFTH